LWQSKQSHNKESAPTVKIHFGANWSQIAYGDGAKRLKTWRPGTEFNPRRQPFQTFVNTNIQPLTGLRETAKYLQILVSQIDHGLGSWAEGESCEPNWRELSRARKNAPDFVAEFPSGSEQDADELSEMGLVEEILIFMGAGNRRGDAIDQ
jgi:hypothetical protein